MIRHWHRWSIPIALLVTAACGELIEPQRGEPLLSAAFSVGDCPGCSELTTSEWNDLKDVIDGIELNEDGPSACEDIIDTMKSLVKDDFGSYAPVPGQSGIHDPSGHGIAGQHIGITEDYLSQQYGAVELGKVIVHEVAHHLGWTTEHGM